MAKKSIFQHVGATFDGSSEYIDIAINSYNYQHFNDEGISLWCWAKSSSSNAQWLIGNWNTDSGDNGYGISIEATTGFLVAQFVHDETGGELIRVESDDAVNDGEWHLFAATYDASDGLSLAANVNLYVDGILVPSTVVTDNLSRVKATETLTSTGQPSDGDTVTIDTKVYTYQTVLTDVDGNVQIAGTQALSMENLRRAINLDGVAGTDYATSMTAHPTVSATDTATTVVAEALIGGVEGNSIVTTEVSGTLSWGSGTLLGGDNRSMSTGSIFVFQGRKGTATDYFNGRMAGSGLLQKELSQAEILELWNAGTPVDPRLVSFVKDIVSLGTHSSGVGGDHWRPGTDLLGTSNTWASTFGKDDGTDVNMTNVNYDKDCPYRGYANLISTIFDGTDDYIDFGDVHDFERTDSFSIEFWFQTSTGAVQALVAKGDVAATAGYEVSTDASGSIHFFATNTAAGTDELNVRTTATGFDDGFWHHGVVTYGGTSTPAGCHIYIDTIDEALTTVSDTLTASILNADPLRFGARSDAADRLTGKMCQVAFFNRVLTQGEVDDLFGSGAGPPDKAGLDVWPSLIGWWNLGSADTAATIFDRASTIVGGNDGTPSGSPVLSADVPKAIPYSPLTKSILLDGVDGSFGERIDFGDFAAVDPERTDAFTVAIWFKVIGGGNDRIFGKAADSTGWRIQHGAAGDGRLLWSLRSATETLQIETATAGGAPAIDDGEWHLGVGVSDGAATLTSSDIHIFIDGVEMLGSQIGVTGTDITTTTQTAIEMLVGESGSGNAQNFNGNVCHAACWSIALSAIEVAELFGNGQPQDLLAISTSASLVFWSALGDGDALGVGNVLDISASSNHGEYKLGEVSDFVLDVPIGTESPNDFSTAILLESAEGQYIDCGDKAVFQFENTDAFSLEVWFKTGDANSQYLLSKRVGNRGYALAMFTSGTVNFLRRNVGGNEADVRTVSSFGWHDSGWHHLIATCDGTVNATGMTLWIDGVDRTNIQTDTLTGTILNAASFDIGALDGTLTFNGLLSDVAVYNKELSAEEVREHSNASFIGELGKPLNRHQLSTAANLVAWYPLVVGRTNGNAFAFDHAVGSFNHGTITGDEDGFGMLDDDGPNGTVKSLQLRPENPAEENQGSPTPPGGGVGIITYFQMRGVDNGTSAFTTWTVLEDPDPNGAQANGGNTTPTLVGSIVAGSGIVISSWQQ